MKSATPRKNRPKKFKLWRCVDQCTTNNLLPVSANKSQWGLMCHQQWHCYALLIQYRPSKRSEDVKANVNMPRRIGRAHYQHVSEFKRAEWLVSGIRFVILRHFGSYRTCCYDSDACEELWIEDGRTQRRAGSVPRNVNTARDDFHLIRMTVTDRTASCSVLSRRCSTAKGM